MAYPTSDTTLRTSLITALVDAGTVAGSRVEDSRAAPYSPEETFPRVSVHVSDVATDLGIGTPGHEMRTVSVTVVGTIQTAVEVDDTSAEVAAALAAALDTFEAQLLHTVIRWSADSDLDQLRVRSIQKGRNTDAVAVLGQVGIVVEAQYQRAITWPTPTNAFETLGLDIDLVSPAGGEAGRAETSRIVDLTEV